MVKTISRTLDEALTAAFPQKIYLHFNQATAGQARIRFVQRLVRDDLTALPVCSGQGVDSAQEHSRHCDRCRMLKHISYGRRIYGRRIKITVRSREDYETISRYLAETNLGYLLPLGVPRPEAMAQTT